MPDAHIKVSGAWKALTGIHTKVSGVWKEVQKGHVKVAGVWKEFYVNFSASADDSTPSGTNSGAAPSGGVTSDVCTITASGGTAPYTYAWAINGAAATSGPFTCISDTSAATAWSATVGALDADKNEVWRCTVTDADLNTVTVDVTVTLTWNDIT